MLVVAICTEGDNSEPAYIKALKLVFSGTAPQLDDIGLQIVSVPLHGNQGHKKILEKADKAIEAEKTNTDPKAPSILSLVEAEDEVEKWIICDFDKMNLAGVDIARLRSDAKVAGYELVVTRPNFEFFILLHFISFDEAVKIKPANYETKLNELIVQYNNSMGFNSPLKQGLRLPKYSKKKYIAPDLFCKLLNGDLLERVANIPFDETSEKFSEMPRVICRIREIYGK